MNSPKPLPVENRHQSPYTLGEKIRRVLWAATEKTLFRYSWVTCYRYRRVLLRCFGAEVGRRVHLRRSVHIECPWNLKVGDDSVVGDHAILYCLGPVEIGKRVLVSQYSHLCAGSHDHTQVKLMPLLREPITVGDDAWIAADTFVGPGVVVGEGALLGARASAFKNLDAWTIYGGNPARPIKPRERRD